jgi:hypothetical protein
MSTKSTQGLGDIDYVLEDFGQATRETGIVFIPDSL